MGDRVITLLRATAVVVVLYGSAMPIAGQEPATTPVLSRLFIRRVASASAREFIPPLPAPGQAPGDWAGVRRLAAGTEVVVTAVNAVGGTYEVLDSDDASLTVLNAAGLAASGHGSKIRPLATREPQALARVAQGDSIISGDLRIAPEGVFVAGRKIGNLQQFLVRVPKADVLAISRVRGGTGPRVGAGAIGGFFGFMGGAFLGGMVGGTIGQAAGVDPSNLSPMFFGLLGGGVTGGYFGYRAAAGPRVEETLIYQAPAAPTP